MQQFFNAGLPCGGWRGGLFMVLPIVLASCGDGGSDGGTSQDTTVGGSVSGLASAASVALQVNGLGNLSLSTNGSYQFSGSFTTGTAYTVTVLTQPSGQTCTVVNGSGTLGSTPISNVAVQCADNPVVGVSPPHDSGVRASQCYAAGSNVLVSCTSAEALALNPAQDGMTGLDVSTPEGTDGKLGFSYTKIAANGASLPASAASWDCVRDNLTGLMWEVKTADGGLRDVNKSYTNHDSTTEAQFNEGAASVPLTQGQIDAATNTVGYAAAVNALGLCGKKDWRLPTIDELQGLVDYGVGSNTFKPTFDETYFPDGTQDAYWTSSPVVAHSDRAWYVYFYDGSIATIERTYEFSVRLVR